jgi:hypothetical protein
MLPRGRVLTSPEQERHVCIGSYTKQFDFGAFDALVGRCPDPPLLADDSDVAALIFSLQSFYDNREDKHLYPAPPAVLLVLDRVLCLDPSSSLATAALNILCYVSATSSMIPSLTQILDFAFWDSALDHAAVPEFFNVVANLLEWFPPAFQTAVA